MIVRRIAYVVNVFPKLSETFIAHELAELRRRGIELRIFSLRQPGETIRHEIIAAAGLDAVTHYDAGEFPARLAEFRPQLLHAHFATEPAAAARAFAATLRVPFTFTAHGYDIRRKPPPDFAERAGAAARVVTVSHANAQHIARSFAVPPEKIRVIPCGVDTNTFSPAETQCPADAPPLIVCVARHVKVKNLGLLLEACALLRDRGVRYRCVSVGDGLCRAELEQRRSELALDDLVEFAGALEHSQVLAWWRRARVAVLTSESEGMPVCLMEAAACGIPAVSTDVGGVPELIDSGRTGLLTPPANAPALADALQRLIENPAAAAAMGRAARARAVERFSLARQVDNLLAAWNEVLS